MCHTHWLCHHILKGLGQCVGLVMSMLCLCRYPELGWAVHAQLCCSSRACRRRASGRRLRLRSSGARCWRRRRRCSRSCRATPATPWTSWTRSVWGLGCLARFALDLAAPAIAWRLDKICVGPRIIGNMWWVSSAGHLLPWRSWRGAPAALACGGNSSNFVCSIFNLACVPFYAELLWGAGHGAAAVHAAQGCHQLQRL